MGARKCSATLTLVLIGAATLSACGDDRTEQRDVYKTQSDCKRDWGDDDKKCERVSWGPHAGYFYGPSYGYGRSTSTAGDSAPRSGSHAVSSTTVSRGGFGSSASSHSSGG